MSDDLALPQLLLIIPALMWHFCNFGYTVAYYCAKPYFSIRSIVLSAAEQFFRANRHLKIPLLIGLALAALAETVRGGPARGTPKYFSLHFTRCLWNQKVVPA